MPGQDGIDESVMGIEQIKHWAIPLKHIHEKANRLLEHRFPQIAGEACEPVPVHRANFLETAVIKPIAAELHRQRPDARVFQHAPRLGGNDLWFVQVPRRRVGQQFFIRHARPEEIT